MDFRELLAAAAAETGWPEGDQVAVLIDFLEGLGRLDPDLLRTFEANLHLRVQAERDHGVVDLLALRARVPWGSRGPRP